MHGSAQDVGAFCRTFVECTRKREFEHASRLKKSPLWTDHPLNGVVGTGKVRTAGHGRKRMRVASYDVERDDPRELISGRAAAGPLAQVQASARARCGDQRRDRDAAAAPLRTSTRPALLGVQLTALAYGTVVLILRDSVSLLTLRIGNLFAAVLTTRAVYFSGDATSGYAIFYLWIGFYIFYYPVSRTEAALNLAFATACYAVAIIITPTPPPDRRTRRSRSSRSSPAPSPPRACSSPTCASSVEQLVSRLVEASRTDPLTGLPNRVGLQRSLEREFERARPDERPLSLLMIDVDRFKAVNDRFGIGVGDRVLKEFGALLVGLISADRHRREVGRRGVRGPDARDRSARRLPHRREDPLPSSRLRARPRPRADRFDRRRDASPRTATTRPG